MTYFHTTEPTENIVRAVMYRSSGGRLFARRKWKQSQAMDCSLEFDTAKDASGVTEEDISHVRCKLTYSHVCASLETARQREHAQVQNSLSIPHLHRWRKKHERASAHWPVGLSWSHELTCSIKGPAWPHLAETNTGHLLYPISTQPTELRDPHNLSLLVSSRFYLVGVIQARKMSIPCGAGRCVHHPGHGTAHSPGHFTFAHYIAGLSSIDPRLLSVTSPSHFP
jgi:hypothetical protein